MYSSPCLNLEIKADCLEYFCPIRLMELLNLNQPLLKLPLGPARRALLLSLRHQGLLPSLQEPIPVDCAWLVAPYTHLRQLALSICAYVAAPRLRRNIDVQVINPWYSVLGRSLYIQTIKSKDWVFINSTEPPAITHDKEATTYVMTQWGASYLLILLPANRSDLMARLNLRLPLSQQYPLPPLSIVQTQALNVWVQEQYKLINAEK